VAVRNALLTTIAVGESGPILWHRGETPSDGGPSVTDTNNTGMHRDSHLIPNLDTLQLSGFCNWRKAWNRAPG
jgi:hypothetical protein